MNYTASASAKTILFGEHAVVYDEPAIAVPLKKIRTYVEIHPTGREFRIISEKAHLNRTYSQLTKGSGLEVLLTKLMEVIDIRELPRETMRISSDIPVASGLGSGAALSVAVIRTFAKRYNKSFSSEFINNLAYEIEKVYHGTPSGIDNTTISYEQPIIFSKTSGFTRLDADISNLNFLIIDSGIRSKTIDVVSDVRKNFDKNEPYIRKIGSLVHSAVNALEAGDEKKIGTLMNENHELLKKIDVSCAELDDLIDLGMKNGALGGKLTGAGRGGNILILAEDRKNSEELRFLYENLGLQVIVC